MEIRPAWQNSAFIIELSNGTQWNSWQNDVIIEAKRIPVFANIEENQEKMLGQDGLYDFGTEYENAVIELDVVVRADSIDNRIAKVAEIARLLNPKNGFQKMIFGDRPDVYYMVKVNNTMQQDLTKHKDLSYFTISLNAHPYAYKLGTSVTFTGNGTDGIEMLIETKTDADAPFHLEIGGNLEVKAPDFWDLKDDSKNVIPNPRFQLNSNGDAVKWNVSQEYNSEEEFYREFGYVKEYPVYSDTQVDFINKIKNGIYLAEEFKIKITYAADTNGYLVRSYHYFINNYEVYTTTETVYNTDWTAQAEYTDSKIATDVNYVFKTLLANKIQAPSWTDYLVHQNLTKGTEYLKGKADTNFFQNEIIEKKWKIINNNLKVNDLKSGNITIKEFGIRKYTTDTTITTDIVVNNVLVYRRFFKIVAISIANAPFEDFEFFINKWSTYYKGVLNHFGLTFANGTDLLNKNMMIFTGNVYSYKEASNTYNPLIVNIPLYEQYWSVVNNVIQSKEVTNIPAEDITSVIVRYMPYMIFLGIYRYVYVVFVKTSDGKITAVYQKNNINSVEPCIADVCTMYGIDKTALTSTDYPAIDTNGGHTDFADPVAWEYTVINKAIQGNPIQIEDTKVVTDMPTKSNDYFEPEHKLPVPAQNQNTITVSFTEQKLMQIPHNAITFNLAPYYAEFESRYRYVYSDVIGLDTLDKDYVLSAYLRDNRGKFGLIILDNNEVFKRVVLRTPQDYTDWSREYFTENLKAEDKKVIVFFEAVNTTRETDTLVMEFALPQLEIFPLSDFTENGTLYSLETRARKNLIDNAGFKFSNDGRMDRWGWTDNSAGMITKQYTVADLPKDLSGKSLGYGVVEVTCGDNSTNTYSAYLSQSIQKVKPNTTYTLSAYLKENGDTTTLKAKLTIIQKNANSAIIDAKTKELTLTTAWSLYSHTLTTKADATSIEIRIEVEKKGFALTSPAVIKIGAIQYEENSMATYWEDDNWETEYLVASKNLLYNPTFGATAGENLPNGWDKVIDSPTGIANTTISLTKATVVGGIERPAVRFNFNDEIDDNVAIWLKNKPFAVNENRYYALSLYCRAKNVVNDLDIIAHTIKIKTSYIDTNGVVISEFIEEPNLIQSTDTWGRYHIKGSGNNQAPVGAVSCVVSIGVTKLDYVGDGAYAEFACIQVEEVSNWDSNMTAWEDNYTFTVKPPEEHSVIKPVYIRNPRIYKADGTLFFKLDATILNTEKIVIDTEKYQAYVTKENGTKINILDDVFIYIYNRLDKQILSTDKMYLRYVDDSGLNENTQEPVAVSVKLDWTARTF
ncbi:putative phage tail component, N-terminal domain-containing protein [Clostridium sp. USBA 49]|uniref:distal tail protein Dit n=1 Tax=Clostridium sp. USBA 49 TaxID=1881060 RepID=UPI000999C18A|nr:distal tail protein Dit [Clostridium sp. USBA 49]SKA75209.1 putative phage tail component, N-terminal domain-containing protein [Clostridium sp. USBA 49]